MAQIQVTAAQVEDLERKNRELSNKINNIEKNLSATYDAKFTEYRNLMRKQMHESSEARKADYEQKMIELKYELQCKVDACELEMLEQYDELRKEMLLSRKEFEQAQQKLREELNKIKEADAAEDERQKREAEERMMFAKSSMSELEKLPCEMFFPGKCQIHRNTVAEIGDLLRRKMYQAAMAVAISAKSAIKLFGIDVKGQKELWLEQYYSFEKGITELTKMHDDWISEWIDAEENDNHKNKEAALTDLLFWTEDKYSSIYTRLTEWCAVVDHINEVGIDAYMSEQDTLSIEALVTINEELQKLMPLQTILLDYYSVSFDSYCERVDMAAAIIKYMTEEQGYYLDDEQSGFDKITGGQMIREYIQKYLELTGLPDDEYRGIYRLVFWDSGDITVEIGIIPKSLNGMVAIENKIVFHVFKNGIAQVNEIHITDVAKAISSSTGIDIDKIKSTNNPITRKDMLNSDNYAEKTWSTRIMTQIKETC